MHQDAVPTWGRGPAIGRQGETLGSLISLASKRRSRSGSALVSVDCLCVAQGCIAGRRGNARAAKKYNVTLLNVPNLFKFGSIFLAVFSWDYTNLFFAPWSLASLYFFASEKLILIESLLVIERAHERCSPPFASTRNHIFLSDIEAVINISEVGQWKWFGSSGAQRQVQWASRLANDNSSLSNQPRLETLLTLTLTELITYHFVDSFTGFLFGFFQALWSARWGPVKISVAKQRKTQNFFSMFLFF